MHQSSPSDTPAKVQKAPGVFRVRSEEDLEHIPFDRGMAAVEMPADLLERVRFKNDSRGESQRLHDLERSIRDRGYQPVEPIKARIGQNGKWVIVDGGHRLTAARHVLREFWTNLLGRKVRNLYFLLFTTPESNTKKRKKR